MITCRSTVMLTAITVFFSVTGCNHDSGAAERDPPPERGQLDVLATIGSADDFFPSSIVRVAECSVWLVGARWSVIVEVNLTSGEQRTVGRLPWLPLTQFAPGIGGEILAWSTADNWAGRIDPHAEEVRLLDIPKHPWLGDVLVGPMTVLGNRTLAMIPLGTLSNVKSPRPWVDVPEVWLLNDNGRLVSSMGSVLDRGGDYLSAVGERFLGSVGDTLLAVNLLDGTLTRFESANGEGLHNSRRVQLPRYFAAPTPSEEVYRIPWIQVGGDKESINAVPHFARATFDPAGMLWAIRNGAARWRPVSSPLYENGGYWEVTDRWLEVYDATGDLVNAYDTPTGGAYSITVDGGGEFFVLGRDGRISIVRNPLGSGPACPLASSHLSIGAVDAPDTPELPVTSDSGRG